MPSNHRRRYFTDRAVQGTLLLSIATHWLLFLLSAGVLLLFIEMVSGDPGSAWKNLLYHHRPTALVVLVLTPIFLRDLCKLSNRFAGPMVRLQRGMHELAEGRTVAPIHFRGRDFWKDLATDFNRVIERVRELEAAASNAQAPARDSSDQDCADDVPVELARS